MSQFLTGKRMHAGASHLQGIAFVQVDHARFLTPTSEVADKIRLGAQFFVRNRAGVGIPVDAVPDQNGGFYLRSRSNETTTDNLLALPEV